MREMIWKLSFSLTTQITKKEIKMSLLETLYAQLSKTTEGSNKFYNIHIKPCAKGQVFEGNEKTCTQNGYEVYSVFGKIDGNARKRHVGFFYSTVAASRSAERLTQSKRQKGYSLHGAKTYTVPIKKHPDVKNNKEVLFQPIPEVKPKMTTSQKNRFSDLID